MALILTAIASFILGIAFLLYFLHKFAHFDFHPHDKDHKK